MKTSLKGRIALAVSEGVVNTAYLDSVKVWTFGIGHTLGAGQPDPKTWIGRIAPMSYIMEVFEKDLRLFEQGVAKAVKVPLRQHEFDALVHFAYNIGLTGFNRSKLLSLLNSGQKQEAFQNGFHGWLKPPELRGRRDKERAMAQTGNYGGMVAPLYTADTKGKLKRLGTVDIEKELAKGPTAPPPNSVPNTNVPTTTPSQTTEVNPPDRVGTAAAALLVIIAGVIGVLVYIFG